MGLKITVELGRTRLKFREVLNLANGSVVELTRQTSEPVDILVNGALLATGEVVVVDDHFRRAHHQAAQPRRTAQAGPRMNAVTGCLGQIAAPARESVLNGSGFSFWQTLGGLVVVFGLLLLFLRLLGKFNRRRRNGNSSLLAVWQLGPRREIQVVRLQDQVHYVYRHDGAMVLLKQESLADWQQDHAEDATDTPSRGQLVRILTGDFSKLNFLRSAPGRNREITAGQ